MIQNWFLTSTDLADWLDDKTDECLRVFDRIYVILPNKGLILMYFVSKVTVKVKQRLLQYLFLMSVISLWCQSLLWKSSNRPSKKWTLLYVTGIKNLSTQVQYCWAEVWKKVKITNAGWLSFLTKLDGVFLLNENNSLYYRLCNSRNRYCQNS